MKVGILRWPGEVSRVTLPDDLFPEGPDLELLRIVSSYAEGVRAGLPSWGGERETTPWFRLIASEMRIRDCAAAAGMDASALAQWIANLCPPNRGDFEAMAGEIKTDVQVENALKVAAGILVKQSKKKAARKAQLADASKRPRKARIPANILELYEEEFESGTEACNVASVLAGRFCVTTDAVRKAMQRARKKQGSGT